MPPIDPPPGHSNAPSTDDTDRPLRGEIALCLSGGGYRAAAFHLGALQLLEALNLRQRIEVLSALSGGSIISACYAIALSQGKDFETFVNDFRVKLASKNPMADAFDRLPHSAIGERPPSLIRALADAYASPDFIGPMRFGDLMDNDNVPSDLIFGATEFRGGMAYRFQISSRSNPNIGNRPPLEIPADIARDMRIADLVGASSCFPAAFEPMIFPDDFHWTRPLDEIKAELSDTIQDGVPLMDGGIYDNQGVDGALAVYRRKDMEPGLLLVCDTSPREDEIYERPTNQPRGGLRLSTLRKFGQAFFIGSLLSTIVLLYKGFTEVVEKDFHLFDSLLFGLPVLICMLFAFALRKVDQRISIEQERIRQQTSVAIWPNISQLRLLDFIDLVNARLLSLISLTNDIFMKRVRSLIQQSLRLGERYRDRVISNQIYDMDRDRKRLFAANPWLRPSDELVEVARQAEAMPSTIWFDNEDQLNNLERCGYATTCFSLLCFLLQKEADALEDPSTEEARLFEQAKAIWVELNAG